MTRTNWLAAGCAAGLACAGAAHADDGPLTAEFTVEIQNDTVFDANAPGAELSDTFATIEGAFALSFGPRTSLGATLVIEPVMGPAGDRFFEDHGLYAEELYLAHDFGGAELVLGKFNPGFGAAWDVAPGIYGVDFAEDYEIAEMLGAAVNIPFEAGGGEHVLQLAAFRADRTFLSDSLGTSRGPLRRAAGGVANTSGVESFSLSLGGAFGATTYNLGYQHQARGPGDVADQSGVVIGATHSIESGGQEIEILGELAWFEDFGGTPNAALYATLGAAVPVGPVTLSGVLAVREIDTLPDDRLATITAEFALAKNVTGAIGYRYGDEGGVRSHALGTLVVLEF